MKQNELFNSKPEQIKTQNNNPIQNQQPNQPTNIKERLLDIESLLLLLESDPDLQSHHQRIFRIIHNILKELISLFNQ